MKNEINILCPVDFSKASNNALDYASRVAAETSGILTLLHVYELPMVATDLPIDLIGLEVAESEETVRSNLENAIHDVHRFNKDIPCHYMIKKGNLVDEIVLASREGKFDLVIQGLKDTPGLERFIFGSNTIRLFKQIDCALLIIPEHYVYRGIENIVYATNYLLEDVQGVKLLINFFGAYKPEIVMLNVGMDTPSSLEEFEDFKSYMWKNANYNKLTIHRTQVGNVLEGLEQFDKANGADMLVMMTRKRTGWEKWFDASLTEKMTKKTLLPLLVLHLQEMAKIEV